MPVRKKFIVLPSHASDAKETGSEDEPGIDAYPGYGPDGTETCLVTIFAEYYDFSAFVTRQALWKRGWVFQERLMAPRTLVFGSDRIYWRCQERNVNEYLPHGLPQSGEMFDQHIKEPFTLPEIPQDDKIPANELEIIYDKWYEVIDYYSKTDLTFPEKDKLSAMAAIARHFGFILPGRYCAGIFKSDLHFGLLWRPIYAYKGVALLKRQNWELRITIDPVRSRKYQAPSWSWASVNDRTVARVRHTRKAWGLLADIENVSIDLQDSRNPFGQIISAELTISGTPMSLHRLLECWTLCPSDCAGKLFDLEASDEKLYALFIMETVRQQHEENIDGVTSRLCGVVLAHIASNRYHRRGVFEADGSFVSNPFPKEGSNHATVVII
ncbi:hypothetical protein E8E13_007920 [Curvularia kusanoi]|uniref:Heterokaryon incompatibility domain-containing protein n=1 Tax=Curvularia kusanoi TaxID=90978 RepID=A0A9P4TMI2_CURKU|nr:hypothetical protein E8E13_007920 [Curvularia kusanoi]